MAKANFHTGRVNRSMTGTIVLIVFLGLLSFLMMFPMVLTVGNAFKPLDELWLFPPRLLPIHPTMVNFHDMFRLMANSTVPMLRYVFNTIFLTFTITVLHIIVASMSAYALGKRRFPGRNTLFKVIEFSLMFNSSVTGIANFIILSGLGWIDTYWSLIIPSMAAPFGLYLMKQFMEQLPDSLFESASMDGGGRWVCFWHIAMPNVKPAWLTLMLLQVQAIWNITSSQYIYSEELKTLGYALGQILAGGIARAGVGSAVSVLMMLVPILVFILCQSNIVETMTTSGMKE